MKKAYVDTPQGQIHYLTEGKGRPLVLLHQLPLSSDEYRDMMPILGERFLTLSMDIPGYGQSDEPDRYYAIEDYAASVIHFLDALKIDKASIVGTHSGAAIGVEVAAACPERVDKLILNGCPYLSPEVRKARLENPNYEPMKIREDASHLMKIWEIAKGWSPNSSPAIWHRWLVDRLKSGELDAHHALFKYEIEKRLPLIKSPTLLIYGTEDFLFERMEQTKILVPNCKTKIVEGGGFILGYEWAEEFSRCILDFL